MPDDFFIPFAQRAYHAYGEITDHKNYQGLPMPMWEELTPKIQAAWVNAVKQVFRDLDLRDSETDKLYVEE